MKYKLIIISLFLIISCSPNYNSSNVKKTLNSKGFAFIYNDIDFENRIIKKKFDNNSMQIGHNKLKRGTLVRIINLKTDESIILNNTAKLQYPEFYKIIMTKAVADKLNIDPDVPIVEIIELKKNKSFVASKAKIYKEEEKIHSNAPVETVKIDNISNKKKKDKEKSKVNMYINVAEFYSKESALLLKKRIINEIADFDNKKLYIKSKKKNKIGLLSGPYNSINLMKNDYILLKKFGFEELDVTINE